MGLCWVSWACVGSLTFNLLAIKVKISSAHVGPIGPVMGFLGPCRVSDSEFVGFQTWDMSSPCRVSQACEVFLGPM